MWGEKGSAASPQQLPRPMAALVGAVKQVLKAFVVVDLGKQLKFLITSLQPHSRTWIHPSWVTWVRGSDNQRSETLFDPRNISEETSQHIRRDRRDYFQVPFVWIIDLTRSKGMMVSPLSNYKCIYSNSLSQDSKKTKQVQRELFQKNGGYLWLCQSDFIMIKPGFCFVITVQSYPFDWFADLRPSSLPCSCKLKQRNKIEAV